MRSLAEQAEAEAAEAEALAAAARARARAIQLRREAELAEAATDAADDATETAAADLTKPAKLEVATEVISIADTAAPSSEKEESAPTEADATQEAELLSEPEDTEPADEAEEASEVEEEAPEEEATADEEATAEDKATAPAPRGRGRLGRPKLSIVAAAVAVVVAVAAIVGTVLMMRMHDKAVQERTRAAEFAAAARTGVVTLTSLDFEHAKEGVKNILEVSTGSFKDDFLKMADDFTNVVQQSKVVSQGTVQATAVDLGTMTENSAVVLVASTSEVTNAAGAKQDPRKYRLIVTVTRDGGQLKMSKVEFVP